MKSSWPDQDENNVAPLNVYPIPYILPTIEHIWYTISLTYPPPYKRKKKEKILMFSHWNALLLVITSESIGNFFLFKLLFKIWKCREGQIEPDLGGCAIQSNQILKKKKNSSCQPQLFPCKSEHLSAFFFFFCQCLL